MEIWTGIIFALLVTLIVKYFTRRKSYNLPPGPKGIPILGNLLQMKKDTPHLLLTKWSEEFGNVYRIKVLGRETVILNDYDTIYEALVSNSNKFAGRPESYRMKIVLDFCNDIAFDTYSPRWVFMKKSAMQALKMYGDNLENLELITLDLIDDLLKELKEVSTEGPVDMYQIIHRCVTGIITSILYGHKIEEKKIRTLLVSVEGGQATQSTGGAVLLDIMPWLRFFPNKTYSKMVDIATRTRGWFTQELQDRKRTHEPGNRRCVVDALFDDQRKTAEKQSPIQLSDSDIYGINNDLIFAGTTTTTLTMYVLIAVLVNKPEIQQQMAEDITKILDGRAPRLTDRKVLPYIEAAIFETLRYSTILPLNLPHSTMEDTSIGGYDIPKNTTVLFNLWKLHHDSAYWDEPWEFKPERYLDEDGSLVPADHINRKRLFAFGAGRRVCVGETLAKNRLFLMVTSLLQHFEFRHAGPNEQPKHDPREYKKGFGIRPHNYKVILVQRK